MPATAVRQQPVRNRLLAALPREEYQPLRLALEPVDLATNQVLYQPNAPLTHVYFPESCVVSLFLLGADQRAMEVAMVGNEGLLGLPLFLGDDRLGTQALCQVGGAALRLDAAAFRQAARPDTGFGDRLQRYSLQLIMLAMQTAACNCLHAVDQRCARWLLMAADRVGADGFDLTHECLARMLGVRRATVTAAAGVLQRAGWIRYRRGRLTLVDRAGLTGACCPCYRLIADETDRLLGPA
jgi:CRP-like cAMP-binding protein